MKMIEAVLGFKKSINLFILFINIVSVDAMLIILSYSKIFNQVPSGRVNVLICCLTFTEKLLIHFLCTFRLSIFLKQNCLYLSIL